MTPLIGEEGTVFDGQTVSHRTGGVRFALVPALLGYGDAGEIMPLAKVPANALLFYRIELLRCFIPLIARTECSYIEHAPGDKTFSG